jgi:hypothetical protein
MKKRLGKFSLGLMLLTLMILPMFTSAYTYGNSRSGSGNDSSWLFIPLILFVVVIAGSIIIQRIKAKKEAVDISHHKINVSSVINEKLLTDEYVLGKINNGKGEFVATDKRLLKFSSKGFQSINYSDISKVSYNTNSARKLLVRIIIGVCLLIFLAITVGVWASFFDSTVRNVSVMDAIIITVICGVIGVIGYFGASHDYGYYQVESDIHKDDEKSWRFILFPLVGNTPNIDAFVRIINENIPS